MFQTVSRANDNVREIARDIIDWISEIQEWWRQHFRLQDKEKFEEDRVCLNCLIFQGAVDSIYAFLSALIDGLSVNRFSNL